MPSKNLVERARARRAGPEPDAHGQAALVLAESLLHALVEATILTSDEIIDAIETACEVKFESATAAGESNARMQASLALLKGIARSFRSDLPVGV